MSNNVVTIITARIFIINWKSRSSVLIAILKSDQANEKLNLSPLSIPIVTALAETNLKAYPRSLNWTICRQLLTMDKIIPSLSELRSRSFTPAVIESALSMYPVKIIKRIAPLSCPRSIVSQETVPTPIIPPIICSQLKIFIVRAVFRILSSIHADYCGQQFCICTKVHIYGLCPWKKMPTFWLLHSFLVSAFDLLVTCSLLFILNIDQHFPYFCPSIKFPL